MIALFFMLALSCVSEPPDPTARELRTQEVEVQFILLEEELMEVEAFDSDAPRPFDDECALGDEDLDEHLLLELLGGYDVDR